MKAFSERVPSPCVGVCQMDPTDAICLGCLRTRSEIAAWNASSDQERQAVWRRVRAREASVRLRR